MCDSIAQRSKPNFPGTDLSSGFDQFWRSYPKQVRKREAAKAWGALKPDAELLAEILAGVARAKVHDRDWKEASVEFIPHPASWLRDRRWEDELVPPDDKPVIVRGARGVRRVSGIAP